MNIEQERADFEAWAKGHYILQRSAYNDTYIAVPTMRAWEVWQARAALATHAAAPSMKAARRAASQHRRNPTMTTTPEAVGPAAGAPQLLKGIGKIDGDGFKDTTRKGEVVFVYAQPLPEPYAPGQYPRVGNTGYSASTEQFDFAPATVDEAREHIEARLAAAADELARAKKLTNDLGKIIHNMTVAQQAAWIEWQHGKGADAAMTWWIQNGLAGPGLIPDEDEPYGKEAQAWYDANFRHEEAFMERRA